MAVAPAGVALALVATVSTVSGFTLPKISLLSVPLSWNFQARLIQNLGAPSLVLSSLALAKAALASAFYFSIYLKVIVVLELE